MKKKSQLKQWIRKERGALVIESAFVYPIMFFVLMFLLYMGNMYYLKAKISSVVSQEAITYAAKFADPNMESFQEGIPTSNSGDTQVTGELYRYLDVFNLSDYGTASDSEKNELIQQIEDTGFFAGMTPTDITVETHRVHNYIVYQTYEVAVDYKLKFPIRFLFEKEPVILDMTAHEETPVVDTSEFIRNIDMAIDLVETTETGGKIGEKLQTAYSRIDEFINGEKRDPSEAVAGGAPAEKYTVTNLQAAINDKTKEYAEKYGKNLTDEQKDSLVKELQDLYKHTAPENRGDILIPADGSYINYLDFKSYSNAYEVVYKWTGEGTVEKTREMIVLQAGAQFDRVGNEYGQCVGEVAEDGSCATVDERSIPYYFTESDITNESSYHRYEVVKDFTKENIYEAINSSAYSEDEKKELTDKVDKYYKESEKLYGTGDGLEHGEIAPMFSSSGGGYQYNMPLNMIELKNLNMIVEKKSTEKEK